MADSLYTATTWGSLIEDSLRDLYRNADRPLVVAVGGTPLSGGTGTTLTLADPSSVQVGAILENVQEQMLVVAKSTDVNPIISVRRGWNGTPPNGGAALNAPLLLEPTWGRYELGLAITRCLSGPMSKEIPEVTSYITTPTSNQFYINLPTTCIRPTRLAYRVVYTSGGALPFTAWRDVDGWKYETDLPTGTDSQGLTSYPTGKIITLPPRLAIIGVNAPTSQVDLFITYDRRYQWATGGNLPQSEADTVNMPLGGDELPSLYASAYLISGRELSRLQVDRIEQWQQEASIRQGVSRAMVTQAWQQFYAKLAEAKAIKPRTLTRPYRSMRRFQ